MELHTILISSLTGILSGLITAYITTYLTIKQEKKKWDREFAMKFLEAKASGNKQAQDIAFQYAIAYPLAVEVSSGMAIGSPRKIFIPQNCRLVVGRSEDNDIVIDDVSVSRKHAMFTADDSDVWIEDLGTGNGVTLRREGKTERISKAIKLRSRDSIEIGNHLIEYRRLER
jgi:pSer/pThr/pTyr-binding forkhead associated (FHA) protein